MISRFALVAALLVLTAVTFYFPGHTYLQSDTQVYAPMMERAYAGPRVLAVDPVATRPHTGLTFYDDVSIALRRLSGIRFEPILIAQQFIFRAMGIWGLWLIATALGLSGVEAFCLTALASLGAAIAGPSVLTIEYEPVPRGFAMGALVLSIGFALHRRFAWAAAAAALATLFHAPTTWPVWPALIAAAFRRNWRPLTSHEPEPIRDLARDAGSGRNVLIVSAFFVVALAALLIGARGSTSLPVFETIAPWLEQVQRMRSSYNWVSEWKWQFFAHYVVMSAVLIAAERVVRAPRWLLVPAAAGLLSIPLSWILLEQMKWSLMTQFQPARAVLWITLLAIVLSTTAAIRATTWWRRMLWLLPAFWIPIRTLAIPETFGLRETMLAFTLASICAVPMSRKWMPVSFISLAFFAIPYFSGVQNYRTDLRTPELAQVADWARENTSPDAVFLFADAKRSLEPGIFRADSLRALYVDWKSGGQANYFADFAQQWKTRWNATGQCEGGVSAAELGALGIQYAVFKGSSTGGELVFRNSRYAVYRIGAARN